MEWIQEKTEKKVGLEKLLYKLWREHGIKEFIYFVISVERYYNKALTQPTDVNSLLANIYRTGNWISEDIRYC